MCVGAPQTTKPWCAPHSRPHRVVSAMSMRSVPSMLSSGEAGVGASWKWSTCCSFVAHDARADPKPCQTHVARPPSNAVDMSQQRRAQNASRFVAQAGETSWPLWFGNSSGRAVVRLFAKSGTVTDSAPEHIDVRIFSATSFAELYSSRKRLNLA